MFRSREYRVIEELGSNSEISLYRVVRINDQMPLIAKTTTSPHGGSRMIDAFQHEYEQLLRFKEIASLEPVGLEIWNEQPVLYFDDPGGSTLYQVIQESRASLKLGDLLEAAIAVSDCICRLHQNHATLHEMTPLSFILNDSLTEASLIDLRFCSNLLEPSPILMSLGRPDEVLPYLSPEQTGRTGRLPDYRSDFYSLGVILYEWFAKDLPFHSANVLDLVHMHLTTKADPVHIKNRSIPKIISEIIQKCMEKMPEDRYLSAAGIRLDLEECHVQLRVSGKVRSFPLATRDIADRLVKPNEMFARPDEQQKLLRALKRAMNGTKEMVWVSGGAGVGKTSFVLETLRQAVPASSFFAVGTTRGVTMTIQQPVWVQWIEELVSYLLVINALEGEIWRNLIMDALEGNGQLLTERVPQLELLIGKQPAIIEMPSEQAQSRFLLTLLRFFRIFAGQTEGLILFLDSLEHSDPMSNELLCLLMEDQKDKKLLIVGSYRDEEIPSSHDLWSVMKRIEAAEIRCDMIRLNNWSLFDLNGILKKLFRGPSKMLDDLANVLFLKTEGNPRYLMQSLNEAMIRGWLKLDEKSGIWSFNVDEIQAINVSNIESINLTQSLLDMEEETVFLLGIAACLGRNFDIETLLHITGFSEEYVLVHLKLALDKRVLYQIREENSMYFFHDEELHQWVYEHVSESDRDKIHRKIGLFLKKRHDEGEEIKLSEMLYHLNQTTEHSLPWSDVLELAELNLHAGVTAKQSGDLKMALDYLRPATDLLKESWNTAYALTWQAYRERAEVEFLCGHDANVLFQLLLDRAAIKMDKAQACIMMVRLEMNRERHDQVILLGEMALELLGISRNTKISYLNLKLHLIKIQRKLRKQPIEEIENFPVMTDVRLSTVMSVYQYLSYSYAALGRRDWLVTVFDMLELTLDHGLTPEASIAFSSYARFLHDTLHHYEEAYKCAKLSCHLAKSNLGLFAQASTSFLKCYESWSRYEPDFLRTFSDSIVKDSMESGDHWHAHYSMLVMSMIHFQYNQPLHHLYTRLNMLSSEIDRVGSPRHKRQTAMLVKLVVTLKGSAEKEEELNEAELWKVEDDETDRVLIELQSVYSYLTGYLFGNYEQARTALEEKLRTPSLKIRELDLLCHEYYYILVVKAMVQEGMEKKSVVRKLHPYIRKLKRLARRSPQSHEHQYLHVRAELAYIEKQSRKAEKFFEEALGLARERGHLRDAGIIAECYARYGILIGKQELARFYMNEAYEMFQKWGAAQKADQLQKEFGSLLPLRKHSVSHSEQIDYLSVAMSAQAMSSEMEMDTLLPRLMRIMLQNAGADYGAIILADEEQWSVEAYGTILDISVQSIMLEAANNLVPTAVISYAARTREAVVIDNASGSSIFERDEYIKSRQLKSVLCLPMIHQGKLTSFMYLENNQTTDVFTKNRLDVLKLLGSQCAISITNVKLYTGIRYLKDNLEEQVEERTHALKKSMKATSEALAETTVYAERNRIAREIHDIVGHSLTSTILQIEAAKRLLRKDMDGSMIRLKETQDLIRHSLNEIRNSVHMLKEDRYYNINEALLNMIHDAEHNTGVVIHAEVDLISHLSMIHKKAIYHALQEGLTNGIRHGKSSEFWFLLRDDRGEILFSLKDNGIGFKQVELGFGLSMMKDRIEQLRGTFSIESPTLGGCHIQIRLPYG